MGYETHIEQELAVEIGGMPILLRTDDPEFRELLKARYNGFLNGSVRPQFEFEVNLIEPSSALAADQDVSVHLEHGSWLLERGDFHARWDPEGCQGQIRQTRNPYAIDSVLRIVHTLILAKSGGFLVHAASAIRRGRAFIFAGVSGAGKTTIARLAPTDAILLSDEVSYVRNQGGAYVACGTPFTGELGKAGENQSAPLAKMFLLEKGPVNTIASVPRRQAIGSLLRNILFFAQDRELVKLLFQSACDFVERVPIERLTFRPDPRVWEIVG